MWIDDQVLKACATPLSSQVWVPGSPLVVLGRSNQLEREVNVRACIDDGVAILKRLGGGGTVLLHPGCVVVSLGLWVKDFYSNDRYFRLLNESLIECLNIELNDLLFEQRGYSDIVHGQYKIAGTSLFRSRNYLLYQASLLIDMQIEWIEKYLSHPSSEPEYRKGRRHREFLTDLGSLGHGDPRYWQSIIAKYLPLFVEKNLAPELIAPQEGQICHVLSRIGEEWLDPETIAAALKTEFERS